MNIPIEERFISTQQASEILQIDEQVLRKLGQMGCKGHLQNWQAVSIPLKGIRDGKR